ncbi:MAG: hypothetical protein QXH66_05940 [Conexivisphaerales archaeon]
MLSEKPTDAYTRVIEDIVPARVVVTKYVVRRRYCCKCGKQVSPEIPNAVSGGSNERFGLRLMLLIASLKLLGLSYEKIGSLLKLLFGPRYDELREELRKEASLHGDETSWMIKGGTTGSGPSWAGGASYTRWLNLAARMCRR